MSIKDRLKKLEMRGEGPERVHAIEARTDEEFDAEVARRVATGEIRPHDIRVLLRIFDDADIAISSHVANSFETETKPFLH